MGKGDKKGALFAMKRKKLYEQEQDKIQNVKMTLETQVINLESAAQNAQTFQALQAGSKTMQKIRTEVGIEEVDDVMDEIKEEMEMAQEINDAIAQPVDPIRVSQFVDAMRRGLAQTKATHEPGAVPTYSEPCPD